MPYVSFIKPLGWIMRKSKPNENTAVGLLLLLFLLVIHYLTGIFGLFASDTGHYKEDVFVQISGDVASPGVYGFPRPPGVKDLLVRAGGLIKKTKKSSTVIDVMFHSGANVNMRSDAQKICILECDMSAFYKITLGIPLSLNRETLDGLTAIRGIGPKIAGEIIRERNKRGCFKKKDEILSIKGIVPALYNKITPYLVL